MVWAFRETTIKQVQGCLELDTCGFLKTWLEPTSKARTQGYRDKDKKQRYLKLKIKQVKVCCYPRRSGEMAQWLNTHCSCRQPGFNSQHHTRRLTITCNSTSWGDSMPLISMGTCSHKYIPTQRLQPYPHFEKNLKIFKYLWRLTQRPLPIKAIFNCFYKSREGGGTLLSW